MSVDLEGRLAALAEATALADSRLDEADVEGARAVLAKAGARLGLGLEQTVVALAGPTGVGKSHLFNALTGTTLAAVGRRRPTTSSGHAAVWGDGAERLLDWLQVSRRHRLDEGELAGLVLLDLPDFDSIERTHRLEADRVVGLADLVLWVVEPQKYADASLHDRYLRPLASHGAAMAIVLNQADLLAEADVAAWRSDMERLLAADGLHGVPLVVASAATGAGVPELRRLLRERLTARGAALTRLGADVTVAAAALGTTCDGAPKGVADSDVQRLLAALEDAAGVGAVVRAVDEAHRRRGALATGWPLVRWIRRFRPDPLRRLRLPESPQQGVRTSLPAPTDVQHAQVANAARALADRAADGLAPPWPRLVRAAATRADDAVADHLDRAVAGADLGVSRPRWWRGAAFLQRVLAVALAIGALWLLALAVLGYLRIEEVVPLPEISGVPLPTWLLLGGGATGIGLAILSRMINGAGARRRAGAARRVLRNRVEGVALELVVEPVKAELEVRERLCDAVRVARG